MAIHAQLKMHISTVQTSLRVYGWARANCSLIAATTTAKVATLNLEDISTMPMTARSCWCEFIEAFREEGKNRYFLSVNFLIKNSPHKITRRYILKNEMSPNFEKKIFLHCR